MDGKFSVGIVFCRSVISERKHVYLFVLVSVAFSINLKRYGHLLPLFRTILLHRRALIFGMAHTHRVPHECMFLQWRSHSSIAGIINYHVFKFMVPLSDHSVLKEELAALRNKDKERHAEWSKLTTRIVNLEGKK